MTTTGQHTLYSGNTLIWTRHQIGDKGAVDAAFTRPPSPIDLVEGQDFIDDMKPADSEFYATSAAQPVSAQQSMSAIDYFLHGGTRN